MAAPATHDLEMELEMQLRNIAVVRPGDTLIIGLHHSVTGTEWLDRVREQFAEALPGVKVVFVGNVTALAVFEPDGGES